MCARGVGDARLDLADGRGMSEYGALLNVLVLHVTTIMSYVALRGTV